MNEDRSPQRQDGLLRLVFLALGSQWAEVFLDVWRIGKRILSMKAHEGVYEVLSYEATLELLDETGKQARFVKQQRVRFLQENIIAYQDHAWGDGNIFATYKCSPGVAVDRYREGHTYQILISLRETKNRGDVENFHIERLITDGFTNAVEDLQTDIQHVTRKLVLSVIFPKNRPPQAVKLMEKNTKRVTELGPETLDVLPDGRTKVTWSTEKVHLFEAYILRWTW